MSSTRAFVSFAVCSGFVLASASGLAAYVVVVGTGDPTLDVPAVQAAVDQTIEEDAAHIEIQLHDGSVLRKTVEHAIGSLARPMSDAIRH